MTAETLTAAWRPFVCKSADGLRLFAREYPAREDGERLPLVCLPGLTRNSADFDAIARRIAGDGDRSRRVLALDFRGRGKSGHDPDWTHYAPPVETEDVCAMLDAADIPRCHFLGTSRGGIVGMMMAALDPARVASLTLNDLGPVLEIEGLKRIGAYAIDPVAPTSWEGAVAALKRSNGATFTALDEAGWLRFARQVFHEFDGKPALAYDPALGKTLAALDLENPLAPLWPLFDTLQGVPLMAIRGENSDLLSQATFAEMQHRRPDMTALSVADEGHAPLLWDRATIDAIAAFLNRADENGATG